MEWAVEYLAEEAVVHVTLSGPADLEQHKEVCEKAVALARSNGTNRFFVDDRKLTHGMSVLQIDYLPELLKESGLTNQDRVAIVFNEAAPEKEKKEFGFFMNTSNLSSLQVRNFTDIEEAMAWLKSE